MFILASAAFVRKSRMPLYSALQSLNSPPISCSLALKLAEGEKSSPCGKSSLIFCPNSRRMRALSFGSSFSFAFFSSCCKRRRNCSTSHRHGVASSPPRASQKNASFTAGALERTLPASQPKPPRETHARTEVRTRNAKEGGTARHRLGMTSQAAHQELHKNALASPPERSRGRCQLVNLKHFKRLVWQASKAALRP